MLRIFIKKYPALRKLIINIMDELSNNPYNKKLKVHKLNGILKDCLYANIGYQNRIIFYIDKNSINFISIGSHDDVYRK